MTVITTLARTDSIQSAATGERENGPAVRFGVTEPISLGRPTPPELALSEELSAELSRDAPLESEDGMKFRKSVLVELQRVIRQWIYEVGIQQGMDEEGARDAGAQIFTFGSYRLGLVSPGSDIDALCVAPRHISRESFFQVLARKLQEHPDVAELTPVPDAYTPIIKMKLSGIEVDLLFAALHLSQIPEDLDSLNDDAVIKNLDDKTVRSLNGCRVADHILSLVPDADVFRDALRVIKIWAKRRGIYSNVLGFFGGITWAILVARVCQLYPYYCTPAIIKRFFRVYDRWNWKNPVVLCAIKEQSTTPGLMQFKIWNPKQYPQDRLHLMPVITPAFPAMNSTHNVTLSTQRIMLLEMARASKVVEAVEQGQCRWAEVYREFPFFTQYRMYLHIEVFSKTSEVFTKWCGWIESKLRHLVKHLEQIPGVTVRPWPNHIKFKDSKWAHALGIFMGFSIANKDIHGHTGQTIDLRAVVTQFVELINQWSSAVEYAGMCDMRIVHVQRRDLPDYAPDPDGSRRMRKESTAPEADSSPLADTPQGDAPAAKKPRVEVMAADPLPAPLEALPVRAPGAVCSLPAVSREGRPFAQIQPVTRPQAAEDLVAPEEKAAAVAPRRKLGKINVKLAS